MALSIVVHNFYRYKDFDLELKAKNILAAVTGNTRLAVSTASIIELQNALDRYHIALIASGDGGKQNTAAKKAAKAALVVILTKLAVYIQHVSEGDELTILSSGFDVRKKKSLIGMLAKPENFNLLPGTNKGSVILSVQRVPRAIFYEYQFAEIVNGKSPVWQIQTSRKTRVIINDLTSGLQYIFRVAAAATDPARVWSTEIASFVM